MFRIKVDKRLDYYIIFQDGLYMGCSKSSNKWDLPKDAGLLDFACIQANVLESISSKHYLIKRKSCLVIIIVNYCFNLSSL